MVRHTVVTRAEKSIPGSNPGLGANCVILFNFQCIVDMMEEYRPP